MMPAQDGGSSDASCEQYSRPHRKSRVHLTAPRHVTKATNQKTSDDAPEELRCLLRLVSEPAPTPTTPPSQGSSPVSSAAGSGGRWPASPSPAPPDSPECRALQTFSVCHQKQRLFSHLPHRLILVDIFKSLVSHRISDSSWVCHASPHLILTVLTCLRIFMRDPVYQRLFMDMGGVQALAELLQRGTDSYLRFGDGPCVVDILKETTNIFQKLSAVECHRQCLVECGVHRSLVLLLTANDIIVLHCTLHGLISLAQSAEPRALIAELNSIETLLRILQDYDIISKKLAANLLQLLCSDAQAVNMVKVYDGIPLLLSLLHSESVRLLWYVLWCLVQLAKDQDMSNECRLLGAIPLLLSLLHERKFASERAVASGLASAPVTNEAPWQWPTDKATSVDSKQCQEMGEYQLSMKSACCTCLTELVLNDLNAQQIVQSNGIYSIGQLILPRDTSDWSKKEKMAFENLQASAFRTLRFLFSMERNRRLFKQIFPPDLFEKFIDIGHYVRSIDAYRPLVDRINGLETEVLEEVCEKLRLTDQNKEATRYIRDYAVLELLGSGGFGSVYKVKKRAAGQTYLAMKEINTVSGTWGQTSKERQKSVGAAVCELKIIREELRHPNIVRYHKTFIEQEKLYIVMELIEGAPLLEHFNSLREKNEHFTEERIWNIFIQMILALKYLHKEKSIVHRDLTPNNVMLGENDKVTITDFGLAKQQAESSKMTSVVGTILYSCPEILQSQPYSEKADIWALGCVLYQMCTLNPPFYTSNMLSLATKIVEADYEPVPTSLGYSDLLLQTIPACITPDPARRPDIVGVASSVADKILHHLDHSQRSVVHLEKRLERERHRTRKHFYEANKNMHDYHRLFHISQERYDKLVNLAGSGGASSIKDEVTDFSEMSGKMADDVFCAGAAPVHNNAEWTSEEETCSSGSEGQSSRENSGSVAMAAALLSSEACPRPPLPRHQRTSSRGGHSTIQHSPSDQLLLDIPARTNRDSGMSSGDPSPNSICSQSEVTEGMPVTLARPRSYPGGQRSGMDGIRKNPARSRPNSATLTISQKKVREINEPTSQILCQLHKIIYICQLPPTLCLNPKRKIVERFKRMLFNKHSSPFKLKTELKKLQAGSQEVIDIHLGSGVAQTLNRQVSSEEGATDNTGAVLEAEEAGELLTYDQMQAVIESVLGEVGYYDMLPSPHATPSSGLRPH